jgi:hypothetical protein
MLASGNWLLAMRRSSTGPCRGGSHGHEPRTVLSSAPVSVAGGSPSETQVKRGERVLANGKELLEKLGGNDMCPCASGRRFQALLPIDWAVRRRCGTPLPSVSDSRPHTPYVPTRPKHCGQ